MVDTLSAAQARRLALGAQGFGRRPGAGGIRSLDAALRRMQVLQIDSVNVFERSHYMPLYSRLGAYDKGTLDRLTMRRKAPWIEYWAHQASFIPVETLPLWRWAMRRRREKDYARWAADNGGMLDFLRSELAAEGPMPAGRIEHEANTRTGPWWGWSDVKIGLEALHRWGEVVTAGRAGFERVYALPEQVLPAQLIDAEVPEDDAITELVRRATSALGVGTLRDIADYWRMTQAPVARALERLVEEGAVAPVSVEGWRMPGWRATGATVPRRVDADALLTPFDPMVWERDRALRMFGFDYRIEIYVPAPKRRYGYYSLPVLMDETVVARIDLKADRKAGVLRVQSAWAEPHAPADVAPRLARLVHDAAAWQSLDETAVADWGDLARPVAAELGVAASARIVD